MDGLLPSAELAQHGTIAATAAKPWSNNAFILCIKCTASTREEFGKGKVMRLDLIAHQMQQAISQKQYRWRQHINQSTEFGPLGILKYGEKRARCQSHGSTWRGKQIDAWHYTLPGAKRCNALFDDEGKRTKGKGEQEGRRIEQTVSGVSSTESRRP